MADKSFADRVAALEAKVGDKTLEVQFREQGEMLDERFLIVHQRLDGIANDVSILKADVSILKADIGALKKDMTIVREGVAIILKKLH